MGQNEKVVLAYGDGIGPEIMDATLKILNVAGARINVETIEVGEKVYKRGYTSGIAPESWDIIKNTRAFLKAPITTPQGGGYKSLNVTIRKALGLYANVRPIKSLYPYVKTKCEQMDVVIVRENEEDLYSGIEYRQTRNVCHAIKLISKQGSEKIIHYAFDYAIKNNRKKVTCFVKDNIMKITDGLFSQIFTAVAKFYPEIENEIYIVDIGSARLAARPEAFDVVVTENLYGDIISDIAAEVSGSVGLAGSANIGKEFAMFEAIHGSAPRIAGQNKANPMGLLNGALMMLRHISQFDVANKIENAVLKTIEEGIHTYDLYKEGLSKEKLGTNEFADAVIKRLGKKPVKLTVAEEIKGKKEVKIRSIDLSDICNETHKELVGVDVFFEYNSENIEDFVNKIKKAIDGNLLSLQTVSCRGLAVWPSQGFEVDMVDNIVFRFISNAPNPYKIISQNDILELLISVNNAKIEYLKTENLYIYDGKLGFSLSQAE